ncbi:transmembrane protein, putative (macronuclear) [Tetrahymena thermophila SB210]|uniref:Transmembrane protein, putative n=1 Tax=Tetrahymena thermophila (strain SB210) TaxID=312017 RepID=W7XFL2_TETTS|nr:transmembrane protein, putative [Tetrahymena thermophila SB210]EWS75628.1 transmembrane protein, putative [Tetrahymena thermophila SB210]|eukprot:XP_012651847.1 transmembrane protein, putative [Tetrahymena thermophila SB210]
MSAEQIINYLKERKEKLENLHQIVNKNNIVSKNSSKRNLDKAIIFSQVSFVSFYSLFFLKIVLFNHYPRFNIAKKFFSLWFYQMTIDPLTLGAGYSGSLLYSHYEDFKSKKNS